MPPNLWNIYPKDSCLHHPSEYPAIMVQLLTRQPLTILVCEDEAIIALALRQTLEFMGHRVCGIAATADDGVALACHYRPDIVMMDIMLRGQRDGIDAAREILDRTGCRSLFMTAVDSPEVRERAARLHPWAFLRKPYRAEELRRILDSVPPSGHSADTLDAGHLSTAAV